MFDILSRVLYNTTRVIARCSMVLDVKRIINTPGGRIPFEFSEDFSDVDFGGVCPAVRPVLVVGQVRNIAGMLRLELALDTTLAAVCDRCGEVFDKPFHLDCEYLLATELEGEENDEILLLEDGTVDLGELSREVFILNMPTKLLCREDCRRRTATRSSCWSTTRWIWRNWPEMRSFSTWTRKLFAPRTVRVFAPAAA
jgi:uncharacterized protein